jgi:5-methylcytosine-specific restriction endonuclease McrA
VTPGTYQLDHVKPINKGGMDCLSNIRPACESCNKSKQDRWPFQPLWRSSA